MGLAYVVAAVSLFDEYANDLLYLEPGSRLPRYLKELQLTLNKVVAYHIMVEIL